MVSKMVNGVQEGKSGKKSIGGGVILLMPCAFFSVLWLLWDIVLTFHIRTLPIGTGLICIFQCAHFLFSAGTGLQKVI